MMNYYYYFVVIGLYVEVEKNFSGIGSLLLFKLVGGGS